MNDSDEVMAFLLKHENKSGPVGEFIRSCILVAKIAEIMTRSELKDSAQMKYLLDCFPAMPDEDQPDDDAK
jgi:hypothetical protein